MFAGSVPENSTLTGEPLISTFSLSPINLTEILYLSESGGVKLHKYVPSLLSTIFVSTLLVISVSDTTLTSKLSRPLSLFSFSSFLALINREVWTPGVPPEIQAGPKKILFPASVS